MQNTLRHFFILIALALPAFAEVTARKGEVAAALAPIKLGGIFSLTGFGAKGGVGEMRAAQLAVEQVNAAGGVGGRKIELIVEDNQSDFKKTISAFKKLVQLDNIAGLVGPNWTEFAALIAPLAEREGIPMVTPSGVFSETQQRSFVFTLMPPALETNRALAEAALKDRETVEVLGLVQENLFLENAWGAAKKIWGGRLKVEEVRISGESAPDYRSMLLRGAREPGVVIYASVLPGHYAALLKARRDLGITAPVFAVDILYDHGVPLDAELLKGVIATNFKAVGSQKFLDTYSARFKEQPLNYGAKAYDAVRILADAYVECGARNPKCIATIDKQGESGRLKFDVDHVIVSEGPVSENYKFAADQWLKVE